MKKWLTVWVLFFSFITLPTSLQGQSVQVLPLLKDELPSQTVWGTYQDKLGYIWIATNAGLCRYDGTRLQCYKRKDGLWGDNITWLSAMEDGNMLIATYKKGITKAYINHDPTFEKIEPSFTVNYDTYLRDSSVYSQERRFDLRKRQFYRYEEGLGITYGRRLYPWGLDAFLITSQKGGLIKYDYHEEKMKSVFNVPSDDSFYALYVNKEKQEVLVGGQTKVYQLRDFQLENIIEQGLPDKGITNFLLKDQEGSIYAANSDLGLYMKRSQEETFQALSKNTPLGNVVINHLMLDKDGNIWVSSWGKGLFLIPHSPFVTYQVENDINTNSIQEIHVTQATGDFYVSSLDDVYQHDKAQEKWLPLHISKSTSGLANYGRLLSDQAGNVIIKNYLNDSVMMEVPTAPHFDKKVYAIEALHNAYRNDKGIFHAHYKQGLVGDTIVLKCFKLINDQVRVLREKVVCHQVEVAAIANEPFYFDDLQKGYWQAMKIGILHYDFENNRTYNSTQDTSQFFIENLQDAITYQIKALAENEIGFATDKGLLLYKEKQRQWQVYGLAEGFPSETIKDIAVDQEGHLWLATPKGLVYFDRQAVYHFNKKNGLFTNDIAYVEFDRQNNCLYAANNNGVVKANKTALLQAFQNHHTELYLQKISLDSLEQTAHKDLAFRAVDNQTLTFELALCDFKTTHDTQYEYRLNDKQWIPFEQGMLSLQNLGPNKYNIQFRATKNQHNWSYTAPYSFTVLAKWYQTIYFVVLLISFIILTSYLIARFFIKRSQARAREAIALNQKIADLEQRALSASMNPHFIFNVLNAIQEYVQKEDVQQTNHYIAEFGKLIRLYLQASLKKSIPLQEELELVQKYLKLEKLRFEDSLNWSLHIEDTLETELFRIPTMIIQPYVENAILHGLRPKGGGTIQISCYEKNDYLHIHITDDGVGIAMQNKASNKHLQLASKITQERIQLFGAEINRPGSVKVESKTNQGTAVQIQLPIVIE